MRICIDARSLRRQMTGLGRYAAHLVYHLTQLDRENEYIVVRRSPARSPIAVGPRVREVALPYDLSSVRNAASGAGVIDGLQADLYHALYHFLPLGLRTRPAVVTLHDLIWVEAPDLADGTWWRRWLKGTLGYWGVGHAVRRADHLIVISDSTRRAAVKRWRLPNRLLTTVHHGVDPPLPPGAYRASRTVPGDEFVLALGNALPYKNLPRLVRAFARLTPEYPRLRLVLAGRGETYGQLRRLVSALGVAERVELRVSPSDLEVQALMSAACFFAFPSLVEGFGMPVLEAMACGCPVLTSRTSSMPEVAGAAALLVNPEDVEAMAAGMRRLMADAALRRDLSLRGRQRAATFTWEACAQKTLDIYRGATGAQKTPSVVVSGTSPVAAAGASR